MNVQSTIFQQAWTAFFVVLLTGCSGTDGNDDNALGTEGSNTSNSDTSNSGLSDSDDSNNPSERLAPEDKVVDELVGAISFDEIKEGGLPNAVYPDTDHIEAEFLFQNSNVCYWEVDEENKTIAALKTPVPTGDEIELPAPSGGDDTKILQDKINDNPGKSFVGLGVYKVAGLSIEVPATIFNMSMEPAANAEHIVSIQSENVRIYNSPIDAKKMNSVYLGWKVEPGSHGFHLVNSGFTNMHHTKGTNGGGVKIQGARDYHIACNEFSNIISKADEPDMFTARANAIWITGKRGTYQSEGGTIANNESENLQSNGKHDGNVDAEFFTSQSHSGHTNLVKIFANRCVNAGKRLTKWQNGGGKALSNSYYWKDRQGELGERRQRTIAAVHHGHDDVWVDNNRIKIAGEGEFDFLFNLTGGDSQRHKNFHFDGNDIEIMDPVGADHYGQLFRGENTSSDKNVTGLEPIDSSARNNNIYGSGTVSYYYAFGDGWDDRGGDFDISENTFDVPFEKREFR